MSAYQHLFGPVPSRRLGRSLGVDLTPGRACTFDCLFCQVGRTFNHTMERREYVPVAEVLPELEHWFENGGEADYVTLAGSGEPTLHTRFGEVLAFVKQHADIRTALLTNGSLLHDSAVRTDSCRADLVKVSLGAWDQESFERLNRPHPDCRFERLLQGYHAFRAQYDGRLVVEVFLVPGINDTDDAVRRIATLAESIGPELVQLNTAVRPTAEAFVHAVPEERLQNLKELFSTPAEVIAPFRGRAPHEWHTDEHAVLAMIRRRPCTAPQIADSLGVPAPEIAKHLGALTRAELVVPEQRGSEAYYVAASDEDD